MLKKMDRLQVSHRHPAGMKSMNIFPHERVKLFLILLLMFLAVEFFKVLFFISEWAGFIYLVNQAGSVRLAVLSAAISVVNQYKILLNFHFYVAKLPDNHNFAYQSFPASNLPGNIFLTFDIDPLKSINYS